VLLEKALCIAEKSTFSEIYLTAEYLLAAFGFAQVHNGPQILAGRDNRCEDHGLRKRDHLGGVREERRVGHEDFVVRI